MQIFESRDDGISTAIIVDGQENRLIIGDDDGTIILSEYQQRELLLHLAAKYDCKLMSMLPDKECT